jgi:hypothetical protein
MPDKQLFTFADRSGPIAGDHCRQLPGGRTVLVHRARPLLAGNTSSGSPLNIQQSAAPRFTSSLSEVAAYRTEFSTSCTAMAPQPSSGLSSRWKQA